MSDRSSTLGGNVLFPDHYCWYIIVGVLDVCLTWVILLLGGREVNAIANAALQFAGHWGLVMLKMLTIAVVVVICEIVGRRHLESGQRLASAAVLISAVAPAWAMVQLAAAA